MKRLTGISTEFSSISLVITILAPGLCENAKPELLLGVWRRQITFLLPSKAVYSHHSMGATRGKTRVSKKNDWVG